MFQEIASSEQYSLQLKLNHSDMVKFNVSVQCFKGFEPFATLVACVPHGTEIFVFVSLKGIVNLLMAILTNVVSVPLTVS